MEEKEYLDLSVHEMKNILAAISGYSEFIYRGLVHGPKALEMAGKNEREKTNEISNTF